LTQPSLVIADLANMEAPVNLHLGFLALHRFSAMYGRLPNLWWVLWCSLSAIVFDFLLMMYWSCCYKCTVQSHLMLFI